MGKCLHTYQIYVLSLTLSHNFLNSVFLEYFKQNLKAVREKNKTITISVSIEKKHSFDNNY